MSSGKGVAVRLDRVSKSFGAQKVLDDVTFEIPSGSAFVLIGRSGAGKSVALRHIIGLVRPDTGRVLVEDRDIGAELFEPDPGSPAGERLSDGGQRRLDSAIAPFLDRLASGVLVIEGYAEQGTRDEQYVRSRARASVIRGYLIGKYQLEPATIGVMPMGSEAADSPGKGQWDGAALAVFLDRSPSDKGKK